MLRIDNKTDNQAVLVYISNVVLFFIYVPGGFFIIIC